MRGKFFLQLLKSVPSSPSCPSMRILSTRLLKRYGTRWLSWMSLTMRTPIHPCLFAKQSPIPEHSFGEHPRVSCSFSKRRQNLSKEAEVPPPKATFTKSHFPGSSPEPSPEPRKALPPVWSGYGRLKMRKPTRCDHRGASPSQIPRQFLWWGAEVGVLAEQAGHYFALERSWNFSSNNRRAEHPHIFIL